MTYIYYYLAFSSVFAIACFIVMKMSPMNPYEKAEYEEYLKQKKDQEN